MSPLKGGPQPGSAEILGLSLLTGAFAVIGQVLFVREGLAVMGGSEVTVAWFFLCWFAGIGLGALAAGLVPWGPPRALGLARLLVLLLPLAGILQTLSLRRLRVRVGIEAGQMPGMLPAMGRLFLDIAPYAFLAGALFPLLAAAASAARRPSLRVNPAGWVYGMDAAGCLAGGVLFTFALAGHLGSVPILWGCFLAGALFLLASAGLRRERAALPVFALVAAAGLAVTGLGLPGAWEEDSARERWESVAPGFRRLADGDSRYQRVTLGERDGQYTLFFNGVVSAVFPDPLEEAMAANLFMNQARDPRSVLLVGQGAEGELQHVLAYPGVRRVTLVFTDPAYLEMVRRFLDPASAAKLGDPRVRLAQADAGTLLRDAPEPFDVIMLHPPPPVTAASNRFYTREFFTLCRDRLTGGGVVGLGFQGDENYLGTDVGRTLGTLYRTLRAVFPEVAALPGTRLLFFAARTPGTTTLDPEVLAARYTARGMGYTDTFTPYHFQIPLEPGRTAWINRTLRELPGQDVNTCREPVLFFRNLKLWDIATDSGVRGLLDRVESLSLGTFAALALAVFVLAPAAWARLRHRRRPRPWRLGTAALAGMASFGFAGMGLEILLLYQFQVTEGSLYAWLGLMTAFFMGGLFAGSWWFSRAGGRGRISEEAWAFGVLPLVATAVALSLLWTLGRALPLGVLWIALQSVAAGAATGGYFPLACALVERTGTGPAGTAARVGFLDYLGALLGAGLTGMVLIPVLGTASTLWALVAILGALPAAALLCAGAPRTLTPPPG
ncbi:MAG: hypothetical protein KA419_14975 [Acidobacteria bacterium]|nr:hypothetical protein [Acidobacteriota bacterium]